MSWHPKDYWDRLSGRTVIGFDFSEDQVELRFDNGDSAYVSLDGDCCSSSYFTNGAQFADLVGATIQKVEERDGESTSTTEEVWRAKKEREYVDSLSWHFLVFETNKGHVTVDWHNDSNGYYDGWASLAYEAAESGVSA